MDNRVPSRLGQVQKRSSGQSKGRIEDAFVTKEKAKQWATGIFAFLILCIFPLVYHDYYFDIIETKYITYGVCIGILAVGVLIAVILWYQWLQKLPKSEQSVELQKLKPKAIWKSLSIPDKAVLAFWLVEVISTVSSEYPFESFWGNEGRYSG